MTDGCRSRRRSYPSLRIHAIDQVLASLSGRVPIPGEAAKYVPVGDPVESIVATARAWPADLVVIGSHGRDGLGRVLLGSVAEGVTRHAPCPVLVVRKASAANT